MADRIPPHSIEAERSALGAAIMDPDALADIVEVVAPDDFYDNANRDIFDTMRDMFNENMSCDIITVADEMKKRKTLQKAGGSAYISSLSSDVPSTANAADYARIVAEKAKLRRLLRASDEIRENCFESESESKDILDDAEKRIFQIAESGQSRDYTSIQDVMLKDIDMISERSQSGGGLPGLSSGFKSLDKVMGGMQPSELIIVAARPAMGKTAFALNMALNTAEKEKSNVLIFDMEMTKEELGQRLISMKANVNMEDIQKGSLKGATWKELFVASEEIGKLGINIDDSPNPSIYEIKNKCRRMKASQGLDLVVIDYLQLMIKSSDNVVQEVSQLTRGFKLLARELDCPVILISQLSRSPDQRKGDHKPHLSDLRDSGSIEQDADIVLFLYRDDYYNEDSEERGICEVNIAKHRSGPVGEVDLTWVARYTKFSDKA